MTELPIPPEDDGYLRCTICSLELSKDRADELRPNQCPRCGTKGLPMLVADDVHVAVNWHELRIIGMWAENWASHCDREKRPETPMQRMVSLIMGRIHAQFPDKSPLTMTGELGDVKRWADENASGMQIGGFKPDLEAEPGLGDALDE